MVKAVPLEIPIPTEDGEIVKVTVDGNMVLLKGRTLYRTVNELRLPPATVVALETALRPIRAKAVFDHNGRKEYLT